MKILSSTPLHVLLCSFMLSMCSIQADAQVCLATDMLHSSHFGLSGQDGIFFDIDASVPVTIECFESYFTTGGNNRTNVQIWYRNGTHIGFETDSTQWIFIAQLINFNVGPLQSTLLHIPIDVDVAIPAGGTAGFYITNGAIGTSSLTGIRYDGSGTLGSVTASDGNVSINDGAGSYDKWVIYSGSRIFSGQVHYSTGATAVNEVFGMNPIRVFPNPTQETLNVDLSELSGEHVLYVIDALGRVVRTEEVNGNGSHLLHVGNLESGLYQLLVENVNGRFVEQFFKE